MPALSGRMQARQQQGRSTIMTSAGCRVDAHEIQQYLKGARGVYEGAKLPHRVFAAATRNEESGTPTGYLSLDDAPAVCNDTGGCAAPAATATAAEGLGYKHSTTLFVQQLQAQEGPVLQQLLQHAFTAMPHLRQVLLVSHLDFDADLKQQQQALNGPTVPDAAAALFVKVACLETSGLWLYECSRLAGLPPLQVRHARVEDHDDLLPIVSAAAAGPCPSLAALPHSCQPDQPFALTRLIGSQDSENLVLVAEDNGKLVGLLVATLQLDVSLLIQAFDLSFCDAFMSSDVFEECESGAKHAAAEKVQQAGTCDDPATAVPRAPTAEQVRQELVQLLLAAFAKRQRQAQKQKQSKGAMAAPHNLAAVTMLCMHPGYEGRAIDFMPALFAELPQQDYCALTLPHSAAQPELARHMTLLRPVVGSTFPQVVLLMHRASLAILMGADWEIRLAVPDDVIALHGLISSMSNSMELQEAFLHAVGRQGAIVAAINGELVGMLATSPCGAGDLSGWAARFKLNQVVQPDDLGATEQHACVDACVLNPIFAKHAGTVLGAALRLVGKTYLHYVLPAGQPAPAEVLAVMQQQRSRHKRSSNLKAQQQQDADVALFSFNKGMAHALRHVLNAQIVIVGASDTGLSCLEHLLLQPNCSFTNLTLLAPGGIRSGGVASQFTAARVACLGLHASVTTVDSHVVALDPQEQLIMLADGGQLPYDLLAVASGMQEQLGPAVAAAFPEAAQFVLSAQQLLDSSITPDLAASLHSVLVYGADLHALDVLSALIHAGVKADAITWVCPGTEQEAAGLPLLRSLANQLGLELPEPQQGRLLDLAPAPGGGARAAAGLQALDAGEDGPLQQMELDLLVGCGALQPSPVMASCLASAYIVWDGRLVVDAGFCSSDKAVMGAGPIAKFSRRYTLPEVMQEHYSSCELGVAIANSIISRLLPPHAAPTAAVHVNSSSAEPAATEAAAGAAATCQPVQQLPALQEAKMFGCQMPGGYVFLCGGCPSVIAKPQLTPPAGGCTLLSPTQDKGGIISICLDACSNICQIIYMGSEKSADTATAADLMGLVGVPFSYLAAGLGLPDSLAAAACEAHSAGSPLGEADEQGLTAHPFPGLSEGPAAGVWVLDRDVLQALQQPWSQLMLHEDFAVLRQQLLAGKQDTPAGAASKGGLEDQEVQALAVAFLHSCRHNLPGYHLQLPQATC